MFHFKIIDLPAFSLDTKIIQNIFSATKKIIQKPQSGCINIVFVDEKCIQDLNKNYRNQDKPTDVLSFHYYEDFTNFQKHDIVGEIVLFESQVITQGKEYGLGSEQECYKLIIHSLLHILGYDHEIDEDYHVMQAFEEQVWSAVFTK